AVVLEVDVPHASSDAPREIQRRLGDWKRVPRIEADADVRSGLVAELEQLAAGKVLMVFDRDRQAFARGKLRQGLELLARRAHESRPLLRTCRSVAAKDRRQ